ncbi:MinD/ParA family protein [Proteinivorax tanatarense]|uniref:MinD/ParA family protein n=1 Tax=Proteinivorax tanatarense TaxID=1260629 RepID=A0AAU7VQD2_9FIRM
MDQAQKLRELVRGKPFNTVQNSNKKSETEIITITSGKGGVGKSNTSVNLACSLAENEKKVLIIDVDIGLGNTDLLLGVYPKFSLMQFLKGDCSLDQAIMNIYDNVDLIAGGELSTDDSLLSKGDKNLITTNLEKLRVYDYVIFDTGAGISSNVTYFCLAADRVLVLTTPEPTAITDAYALIKSLYNQSNEVQIEIVVNKASTEHEGKLTGKKLITVSKKFLSQQPIYLGFILEDKAVTNAVRKQVPYVKEYPSSPASKSVCKLAANLTGNQNINPKKRVGFLASLFKR